MKREPLNLTEEDGYDALRGHVLDRALLGRERYGPTIDEGALLRLIQDREVIRFPTYITYEDEALMDGEFAWARPRGERPKDGYDIVVATMFQDRPEDLVAIVAYHLVRVNYLDVATHTEAELFGAALLGIEIDDYYSRLCGLADELPRPAMREILEFDDEDQNLPVVAPQAMGAGASASGGCGQGCGCV
ncbi:MAG: hypothetical protein ACJA0P_002017 [Planctomycetota bacterium]|jgi:hypothetical protein